MRREGEVEIECTPGEFLVMRRTRWDQVVMHREHVERGQRLVDHDTGIGFPVESIDAVIAQLVAFRDAASRGTT